MVTAIKCVQAGLQSGFSHVKLKVQGISEAHGTLAGKGFRVLARHFKRFTRMRGFPQALKVFDVIHNGNYSRFSPLWARAEKVKRFLSNR
jgi:hypothetical protein